MPAQIQHFRPLRTAHGQWHLRLHRHIHHCPYKQIIRFFVLFISRRYQLLTLYNLEYDCWTTKWTRFNRHDVFSAVLWVFKVSCSLYRVDWLAFKTTDVSEKHGFSIFKVNLAEMFWFPLQVGCTSRTLWNSLNQRKYTYYSFVHAWLTEDSKLSFHEGTAVNFTDQRYQGCPLPQSQ